MESDIASAIGVAADGSVYTAGQFNGSVDFDPGADVANLTATAAQDIFVSRLDADGNYLWAGSISGGGFDQGIGIDFDGSDNVYVIGAFQGTADFDPGPNTFALSSDGVSDAFVAKYDNQGDFAWARSMGDRLFDTSLAIDVTPAGDVFATGLYNGSVDFDGGPGVAELTSVGANDAFIVKLDTNGDFGWARSLGGPGGDQGHGVAIGSDGSVYTTGAFQATADFDPGPGVFNLTSNGVDDIYIAKLDANGDFEWAHGFGQLNSDRGFALDLDAADNLLVTGRFYGTIDFDPGPDQFLLSDSQGSDAFVLKLDSDGNFDWAGSLGGTSGGLEGVAIQLDSAENIYIAGFFRGSADFDPGAGVDSRVSNGSRDAFLTQLTQIQPLVAPQATIDSVSSPRIEGVQIEVAGIGTDADSDNTALAYSYEVLKNGDKNPFAAGGGVGQTAFNFTPDDDGDYQIKLMVTDQDGLTGEASQLIQVGNDAPTPSIDTITGVLREGLLVDVTSTRQRYGWRERHARVRLRSVRKRRRATCR